MPNLVTDWHAMEARLLRKLADNTRDMNQLEVERAELQAELDRVQAAKLAKGGR